MKEMALVRILSANHLFSILLTAEVVGDVFPHYHAQDTPGKTKQLHGFDIIDYTLTWKDNLHPVYAENIAVEGSH